MDTFADQGSETGSQQPEQLERKHTLLALINLIIPPSEDGRMPGAAEVDFTDYLRKHGLTEWALEGLTPIVDESRSAHGEGFWRLKPEERARIVEGMRRRHSRYFDTLASHVVQCYYQHDLVLKAIGMPVRAPFPDGYPVEEGDLTLLEPVFERGKIYRDA